MAATPETEAGQQRPNIIDFSAARARLRPVEPQALIGKEAVRAAWTAFMAAKAKASPLP